MQLKSAAIYKPIRICLITTLLLLILQSIFIIEPIQNNMPPASNNTINSDDVASNGNVLIRFLPMRSSTSFFVEAQTDANDFTDLEGNHHNSNSSEAEAGSNEFANANVGADSNSSNGHEKGQEVERRVSDGGDGGDPSMDIDLQFDSSSSAASSHPAINGIDNTNHRQDSRKGWVSICKPNWSSFVKAAGVGVVVACVYAIINNNMKKNALINDLQNENASLKEEQQYLLDISQLGSAQAQQGGGKKGKAGKDECACPTSSPSTSPFPSESPTETESVQPSDKPSTSNEPSLTPSVQPSDKPSGDPSLSPSAQPSDKPSNDPSLSPSSIQPSSSPSSSCDAQIVQDCIQDYLQQQQQIIQRESLIALYDATNGDDWNDNAGWLSDLDECNWYGVTCNGSGIVTALTLNNNNLIGTIPTNIGDLSQLEILDLGLNQLSGPIPSEIGNMVNLVELKLYNNDLTGSIPSELGGLSQLQELYLYNNKLSGSIPSELGGLSQLKELYIPVNKLTGSIPDQVCALRPDPLSSLFADCSVCRISPPNCCTYCF